MYSSSLKTRPTDKDTLAKLWISCDIETITPFKALEMEHEGLDDKVSLKDFRLAHGWLRG